MELRGTWDTFLQNSLYPGAPVNPPNGGGYSRIRTAIKTFVGFTHDEEIAYIISLISNGNIRNTPGDNMIADIKRVDPNIKVINIDPIVDHGYVLRNGEFTDIKIPYKKYMIGNYKKLIVLRHMLHAGRLKTKVYALFDSSLMDMSTSWT